MDCKEKQDFFLNHIKSDKHTVFTTTKLKYAKRCKIFSIQRRNDMTFFFFQLAGRPAATKNESKVGMSPQILILFKIISISRIL